MAKVYRGDTLPVVISYDNYKFKAGDVVTAAILKENESGEYDILKEITLTVQGDCDEVQIEFSREDMHDIDGDVIVESRCIIGGVLESTLQKKLKLRRDGLR